MQPLNNKKTFLLLFLILIFTFILYSPVINYDFLRCWDDYIYTIENQIVKEGMSLIYIDRIFGSFLLGNYHPLTLLMYTFDYSIFGFQPQYFHLVNLLLHLMNCLFVFVLIYRVSKRSGIALITTLIFAIHPLRIEPVAWISGRKDLLAAMFAFLSLIAYTYYQKQRKLNVYILCLVAFILSLLSKAMVLGLPAMLFLMDYLNKKHLVFDRWFEKIPFFIVSIGFGIIAWIARQTYQYQLSENVL